MCYIGVLKTLHLALCTQNNGEQTDKVYIASHSYVYEQLNKDKEARIEMPQVIHKDQLKGAYAIV